LVPVWAALILLLKQDINTYGDEVGYHTWGLRLADEIGQGHYVEFVQTTDSLKYIGYYTAIGLIYTVFGPHHQIARAFNFLPLIATAIVAANIGRLIAGPKAARLALLLSLTCPLFTMFGIVLYRDAYVLFGVAIILHHIVATTATGRPPFAIRNISALVVAYVLLGAMRIPQAVAMGALHGTTIALILALARRGYRLVGILATLIGITVIGPPALNAARATTDEAVFVNGTRKDIQVSKERLVDVGSSSDLVSAVIRQPLLLPTEYVQELTGTIMGPVPVTERGGPAMSAFDDEWDLNAWEGNERIDIILQDSLFWPFQLLLAPFVCYAIVEMARRRTAVFCALTATWVFYATVIAVQHNDARWGLPMYFVMLAFQVYGWQLAKGSRVEFVVSYSAGFALLAIARLADVKLPIVVLPVLWTALLYIRASLRSGAGLRASGSASIDAEHAHVGVSSFAWKQADTRNEAVTR
jgi:hypothetical protein